MYILKKIIVFILTLESRLILRKYKPFIIAVTGSVGKTSTKDAIYNVLKDHGQYVRKSEKSFNTEFGLPLTIIGVPNAWRSIYGWLDNIYEGLNLILFKNDYPDCLILELGADHPGDIERAVSLIKPNISVITQVSDVPVHVEFFSSPEEVIEEKAKLVEGIKTGGTLVLFADNEKIMKLADRVREKNVSVISFGTVTSSNIKGKEDRVIYDNSTTTKIPTGFSFNIDFNIDGNNKSETISVQGILGKVYMYPLLAAAAVAKARDISITDIINGLNSYNPPRGRMNIISGINDSCIIDDSYNSSPDAVSSALQTLKSIETSSKKIAVLGDMMELGSYSTDQHRIIGREVVNVATMLVTVGQRSRALADEAVKNGLAISSVKSFDTADQAGEYLKTVVGSGDIVLIKGSQSIRLEKTVKALMKEPELAEKLLVRQEKQWLER